MNTISSQDAVQVLWIYFHSSLSPPECDLRIVCGRLLELPTSPLRPSSGHFDEALRDSYTDRSVTHMVVIILRTYSFIQTANVPITLPVLSKALYACLTSSVKASALTPAAPLAARTMFLLRRDRGGFLAFVKYRKDFCRHRVWTWESRVQPRQVQGEFWLKRGAKLNPFIAETPL